MDTTTKTHTLGVIMNGVTGRMGTNQHLLRSIVAIREQGGVPLGEGEVIMPDPILVGRNAAKLEKLAAQAGGVRWTIDLDEALADQGNSIYFDAQLTNLRAPAIKKAIEAGKNIYCEKPTGVSTEDLGEYHDMYCCAAETHRRVWNICLLLLLVLTTLPAFAQSAPRERLSLDADWRFQKDDPTDVGSRLSYFSTDHAVTAKDWVMATGNAFVKDAAPTPRPAGNLDGGSYAQPGFDDSGWRRLNLPHDWAIEGPFKIEYPGDTGKLQYWGVGWYRKHFTLPAADAGKRLTLAIDGAMSYSMVWLNGQFVGGWPYGYSSYQLDLTPYIKPGAENVLAIRLDNPNDSSRWYPGAGIYRNVWLIKTTPVHVGQWGTYVTTPQVSPAAATVALHVSLDNDSAAAVNVQVTTRVYEIGANGQKTKNPVASFAPQSLPVPANGHAASDAQVSVRSPKLWQLTQPHLYAAVTTVTEDGKVADSYETDFGIRTIRFDAEHGFFLNGQHIKINGVCDHHDLGALGAAINVRALERQIQLLQEMGCNAIRTSHNPPSPELLMLCDRMGMLVMDELTDTWLQPKRPNGYAKLFNDWHEKDLRTLVRRDRNHPCVILWSTGNEVGELGNATRGAQISSELTAIVHEEDPTRPVTLASNNIGAGYSGIQTTLDVWGYNYKPGEYAKFHAANPTIPLFGSETTSTLSSRGEYFFPGADGKPNELSDFQVSSYDEYFPPWATTPDTEWKSQDQNSFVAGEFVWTGFDYLGEPTPYNADSTILLNFQDPAEIARAQQELQALGKIPVPSRSSYFGIIDLAGFKKDRFYLYQAHWRPDFPMAHILPHWNWPERVGQVTPVYVYTSGDEAELFLNGHSLGRRTRGPLEYRLQWDDVKYQPGTLRVVAYKGGKHWAEDVVKTTGPAAKLTLRADRSAIGNDGLDLSYITVTVADAAGLMVPRSHNRIRFSLTGPGEIVATDNGDATDLEPFQATNKKAYNGLCLVIVRAKSGQTGKIALQAQSDGLQSGSLTLTSVPASADGALTGK